MKPGLKRGESGGLATIAPAGHWRSALQWSYSPGAMSVPELRVTRLPRGAGNPPAPERPERDYVLYWMISNRRAHYNFALDRAIDHARRLKQPLVVLEALRV